MDFFTKKELNGLKGDLKASEIAINASKATFQKKLIEQYGKEMENAFNTQAHVPTQISPTINTEPTIEQKPKSKKCWLKRLFSI